MSPRLRTWLSGLILSVATVAHAAVNVDGITFQDTVQVGGQSLQLNGAGKRVRIIIDVYAMGLYTAAPSHEASSLLKSTGAKSIKIVLMRDLSGEDFAKAMEKGMEDNHSASELAALQSRLQELSTAMRSFGKITKGTVVDLNLVPGSGVRVLVNGQARTKDIPGEDFYAGIMRIWLGASAVDKDLKTNLLGKH